MEDREQHFAWMIQMNENAYSMSVKSIKKKDFTCICNLLKICLLFFYNKLILKKEENIGIKNYNILQNRFVPEGNLIIKPI